MDNFGIYNNKHNPGKPLYSVYDEWFILLTLTGLVRVYFWHRWLTQVGFVSRLTLDWHQLGNHQLSLSTTNHYHSSMVRNCYLCFLRFQIVPIIDVLEDIIQQWHRYVRNICCSSLRVIRDTYIYIQSVSPVKKQRVNT